MGLYLGGLIIRKVFASMIWVAYIWEGLFLERHVIGLLWYIGT